MNNIEIFFIYLIDYFSFNCIASSPDEILDIEQMTDITTEDVHQTIERITRPTSIHIQNQSSPFDSNKENYA